MNWRCILALSTVTVLGLALQPSSAVSQQKSLKDQLVGGWHLVAWERSAPDGTKVQAYGANPKGTAYFGADGRFFVLFARGDLPKIAANDRAKATPEEAKALVDGAIAYSGTYTVDEPNKTINLRLEVTTFPNQSSNQKRTITSLTPDELKITNPTATAGGRIDVTMKRAPAAATN
jgi:Lipocalin-like domain